MSVQACAELVRKGDAGRFAAVMAAPPAARAALFTLYAFNLEVARAAWASAEPMVAEMRLQWWRDAVAQAASGGPVAGNEVLPPLAALIRSANLPVQVLDAAIAARRWELYRDPFADQAEFDAYINDTAGGLAWLAVKALGAGDDAQPLARDAGCGIGLAAFLQAVPDLGARGRKPLPDANPDASPDAISGAIGALAGRGLVRLHAARKGRASLPPDARPALLQVALAVPLLALAKAEPARVLDGTLHLSEFRRRGLMAWAALSGRW